MNKKLAIFIFQFILSIGVLSAQTITTSAITGASLCAGSAVNVPYTKTGTFNTGNIFTAQLSDAAGSFASPISIGTLTSVNNGTISATIPGGTATGTGYRIRVVGSNPVITGTINTVNLNIYNGVPGTPNTFGNGFWNAYVYNAMDYATNYSGTYSTGSALNYNTTSDFTNTSAPSLTASYQGCQIGATAYSIRYQRTGFTPGVYQIGININDDNMDIILNGVTVYSSGYSATVRTNVWTGTLNATSQLEIRYLNNTGAGQLNFTLTPITNTSSTGGTVAGNQSTCNTVTPITSLTNVTTPSQGSCTLVPTPVQWQSSTDNITFTNISGANANAYTIPSPLSQTTYFRRAYRTYCDTVYSNTLTVTVYVGTQGTPNTFGNGIWNAYVYNAINYSSNYSGFFTTPSALSFNTTTSYTNTSSPSSASTYQGCPMANTNYSVRFQRTGFTPGSYQIGLNLNDDNVDIILNGTTIYSSGYNNTIRANVWSGTLTATSQVEIRYYNGTGPGELNFVFSPLVVSPSNGGTITGNQLACNSVTPTTILANSVVASQGSCNPVATPYQWQSSTDNVTFSDVSGANATAYTIPAPLAQTTYFRRAYRTFCDTAFSNTVTVTVYNGAQGTPNAYGNGVWNAYVYNATDYSTNYIGYFTTPSALTYNTTSDFANTANPSSVTNYQGCVAPSTNYSIRFQRTNFTAGTYQLGVTLNDDNMDVIVNGVTVYSSGYNNGVRSNVWTGALYPTSQVEIRYLNNSGPGEINFTLLQVSNTPPNPGVISGNQNSCSAVTPTTILANVSVGSQGSCNIVASPYQWQSSIDNVTFANISGANATSYTIPAPLAQTTYFRRAYISYCDTAYTNVVTVSVYNGAQGTPNTFGNGLWNAYVYNAADYTTNYTGYYTTPSALSYNTNTDFGNTANPSSAPNYQGCITGSTYYSVRFQRTGFTAGTYQIGVNLNDDNMDIILNGTTIYSSGYSNTVRNNVWTGVLSPTSQLEIRYLNNAGPGELNFTLTNITYSPSNGGTISGTQTCCSSVTPTTVLGSSVAGSQGSCAAVATPYQWQSSTNNVTFANISGANVATYTIPAPLSQTTYFRRAYRTFCDTAYSNTITVTIYSGAQGTPNTYGNGVWNAYVYNATDYVTNYSGYYTSAALSYNSLNDFGVNTTPSLTANYQGCAVAQGSYSIRYQRTNFTPGTYQIDIANNDDGMNIILNGTTVYSSGYSVTYRPNVWTGTLNATSQLEIRYQNTGGAGQIAFNLVLGSNIPATPGTISGNQVACTSATPITQLGSVSAAVRGTCAPLATPYQWQSSTDNISYSNISGATATTYTIPSPLAQTTYYRRAYSTTCETVYSNVITVTVYAGAQGTPNTFGNGVWNAYVYNATDYTTNYSGFYTTASGLSYNTTTDFAINTAPSLVTNYQGCHVSQTGYSVRYQRTNFATNTYQIDVANNDDGMDIILNGTTIYSSGISGTYRTNVWTGTLNATSQLEIRYTNSGGGNAYLSFNIVATTNSLAPTGGTISGNQNACSINTPTTQLASVTAGVRGTCSPMPTPYQWQSSTDNISFTNISGATAASYTIPAPLALTTYFRRSYTTSCETVYSNTVTVTVTINGVGTPNTYGNNLWNAYVYNATDYTSNYSGYYTTGSALSYNTTTNFAVNAAPSTASNYQGCAVTQTSYSVRYQRTNFASGTYQIDVANNDNNMDIILDGITIYTASTNAAYRTNVWTGSLSASSLLEVRYLNSAGNGSLSFNLAQSVNNVSPTPGSIAGNQVSCSVFTPTTQLTSVSAAVRGTCNPLTTPYQWHSSTDNITFSNISGANAATYTIPAPLSQTTYFRRAYTTACETVYSNTVTVTIYAGGQGTPNTYGNGVWNAYVYNATDYTSNYSGYYVTTTPLSYSTTNDFTNSASPSTVTNYQGCQVTQTAYSVRYQRTNFATGSYRIGVNLNNDNMDIILNGSTIYSSANSGAVRTNVWTGTLNATSQLEIRYLNSGGTGELNFVLTSLTATVPSNPGVINGNQSACSANTPSTILGNSTSPSLGSCAAAAIPVQWQSSTNNITFTNISGANANTYTIPAPLSQTTYFRRSFRSVCDTVFSNVVAVTITSTVATLVSIAITTGSQAICPGTSVTFTATGVNGGSPSYQWKKNGVNTNTGTTYTSAALVTNDVITCVMTSTLTCASPVSPTSNSITMTVGGVGIWLGTTSNNWATGSNWCGGAIPISTTNVSISTGVPFQPQLSAASVCTNLTIGTAATLSLNGQTLTVSGAFSGAGTLIGSSTSSLSLTGIGDAGTFNMSSTSASSKSLGSLTLNKTSSGAVALGDTLNIINTLTLTNGTLTTNGKLKLYASSNSTGRIATIIPSNAGVSGNIIAEGYAPGGNTDWAYLGSPVTNATIADWTSPWDINNPATSFGIPTSGFTGATGPAGTGGFNSVYSYDESVAGTSGNGYVAATNVTNPLVNGQGYDVYLGRSYGTTTAMKFRVTGTAQTGNKTMPVTYTNNLNVTNDGWNLVANPYPSPIDWNSGSWTKTNMDNAIYIYNADYGGMSSYVSGVGTNGGSNIIAMHQGFMVKANAASPSLIATESVKVSSNQALLKTASDFGDMALLKLTLSKNGTSLKDESIIRFNSNATIGFDGELEATKLYSSRADGLNLMTVTNNMEYAINALPTLDNSTIIPIKMKVSGNGIYTLELSQLENVISAFAPLFASDHLVIEDLKSGNKTDLKKSMDYTFVNTTNDSIVNFVIHFSNPSIVTNINKNELFDILKIRQIDGEYFVETNFDETQQVTVRVYNNIGQEVVALKTIQTKSGLQKIDMANLNSGIYFISVSNNFKTITNKIFKN